MNPDTGCKRPILEPSGKCTVVGSHNSAGGAWRSLRGLCSTTQTTVADSRVEQRQQGAGRRAWLSQIWIENYWCILSFLWSP